MPQHNERPKRAPTGMEGLDGPGVPFHDTSDTRVLLTSENKGPERKRRGAKVTLGNASSEETLLPQGT